MRFTPPIAAACLITTFGAALSSHSLAQTNTNKIEDGIKQAQKSAGAFENSDKATVKSVKIMENIYAVKNFCIIANGKFKESLSDVDKIPGITNIALPFRLFALNKGDAYCRINYAKKDVATAGNLFSPRPAPTYSLKAFANKKEIDNRTGNCFAFPTCKPNALKAGATVDGFAACFDVSGAAGTSKAVVLGVGKGLPDNIRSLVGRSHDKTCQDLKF
jgi:hypothetical protein